MLRSKFQPATLLNKAKNGYKRLFGYAEAQVTTQVIKDMDVICSTFLCRHQFKYGYMGAMRIYTLNAEARQRMMDNQLMIDELKGGCITTRLIAYLFISETCQSFLSSDRSHTEQGIFNTAGEAVFDLLKFALHELCQEKFLDKAAVRDIMESMNPA